MIGRVCCSNFFCYKMLRLILVVCMLTISVISQLLNKEEGSSCIWKGAIGTCVSILKCRSAMEFLQDKDYPPICTFQGKDPVVCCTECSVVDENDHSDPMLFNANAQLMPVAGRKVNDKCVHYVDHFEYDCNLTRRSRYSRILNRRVKCMEVEVRSDSMSEATNLKPSYLALLGYGDVLLSARWLCAGTIISERFVLTAASCLIKKSLGPVKFIAARMNRRTDSPGGWKKYNVNKVIPYPGYRTYSKYHDIALIETDKTIIFRKGILPACLHADYHVSVSMANILVWDPDGEDQGVFKEVPVSQIDPLICSVFYPPQNDLEQGFNDTTQMCYGNNRPTDSCRSDVGSPLLASEPAFGCAPNVLGVMSYERTCGSATSSGLFTKIQHYIPWIENIVWRSN